MIFKLKNSSLKSFKSKFKSKFIIVIEIIFHFIHNFQTTMKFQLFVESLLISQYKISQIIMGNYLKLFFNYF